MAVAAIATISVSALPLGIRAGINTEVFPGSINDLMKRDSHFDVVRGPFDSLLKIAQDGPDPIIFSGDVQIHQTTPVGMELGPGTKLLPGPSVPSEESIPDPSVPPAESVPDPSIPPSPVPQAA